MALQVRADADRDDVPVRALPVRGARIEPRLAARRAARVLTRNEPRVPRRWAASLSATQSSTCAGMLCYAMLWHAMLCHAVLCDMLCYAMRGPARATRTPRAEPYSPLRAPPLLAPAPSVLPCSRRARRRRPVPESADPCCQAGGGPGGGGSVNGDRGPKGGGWLWGRGDASAPLISSTGQPPANGWPTKPAGSRTFELRVGRDSRTSPRRPRVPAHPRRAART